MHSARRTLAATALCLTAGLAAAGVWMHYGLTVEYGDVTGEGLADRVDGVRAGIGGIVVPVVGLVAVVAAVLLARWWLRLLALAIPVVMVLGMLAVTPSALRHKLAEQYDAAPQCLDGWAHERGPGRRAAYASQRALDSIAHTGHFARGGGSGVQGCDRSFVLTRDVDVVDRYRAALAAADWHLVDSGAHHLCAVRGTSAFALSSRGRAGVVWAGPRRDRADRAGCGGPLEGPMAGEETAPLP